jgi:hypothetical protein
MSNLAIAARIPDRVRSERLLVESDPIRTAIPVASNPELQLLFAIWYEFIEPKATGNMNCPYCLNNIVTNFKAMLPDLLELEREYQLLLQL